MLDDVEGDARVKLFRGKITVKFPHITVDHLVMRVKPVRLIN